jgi:hypothetical protein
MIELRYLLALRAVNAIGIATLEYSLKASIIGRILLIELLYRIFCCFHFSLPNSLSTMIIAQKLLYVKGYLRYSIIPVSEKLARGVSEQCQPEPVHHWEMPQLRQARVQRCRVCGCTEENACIDPDTGEPCYWVEPDLCSVCAEKENDRGEEGDGLHRGRGPGTGL